VPLKIKVNNAECIKVELTENKIYKYTYIHELYFNKNFRVTEIYIRSENEEKRKK